MLDLNSLRKEMARYMVEENSKGSLDAALFHILKIVHNNAQGAGMEYVNFVWTEEDVKKIRPDLNSQQALAVLQYIKMNYDKEVGVNNSIVRNVSEELFIPPITPDDIVNFEDLGDEGEDDDQ